MGLMDEQDRILLQTMAKQIAELTEMLARYRPLIERYEAAINSGKGILQMRKAIRNG